VLRELFGGGAAPEWSPVDLPRLSGTVLEAARAVESRPADREMLFIRLCDTYRAMDLDLPAEKNWEAQVSGKPKVWPPSELISAKLQRPMDDEAWKRLHLLVESLQDKSVWELVRQRCVEEGTERVTLCLFVGFAQWSELLTIELLLKSPFRIEEFARKWLDVLGGTIAGEDAKKSEKRLRDLDYGKVLENLQKAQAGRAEHQRRMQEELERRRREEYERTQRE
jgi:hypothetical protein